MGIFCVQIVSIKCGVWMMYDFVSKQMLFSSLVAIVKMRKRVVKYIIYIIQDYNPGNSPKVQ
jgi:hypothetical protein